MSGTDDRIVSMRFDNEAFERKLEQTIRSLDALRKSLDFSNSKKGLEDLSKAGSSFNMGNMGATIDGISNKFLAMATVGITALANITNRAVDAGIQMAKSFTLDPVTDGFREFETNMNSIQTILANTDSKGSTLEDVNKALDELNHYSDKTIYNFSQMARNIGTFTAAGVDLETSTGAIKGIANLAAVSGSNAEQASSAMYQLSQAMASGTVKLMDWNSVVNAGMGGEVFKKALFEAGQATGSVQEFLDVPVGTTFEEWTKSGGNFRESLQEGWITTETLTTALQGMTGDLNEAQLMQLGYTKAQAAEVMRMGKIATGAATEVKTFSQLIGTVKESIASGWSQSFRTVIGDFAQSKALFTEINTAIGNMVGRSADARNKLLEGWSKGGGRETVIDGFRNALEALGLVIKPIKEAFREIFPKRTVGDLIIMSNRFKQFTANLKELATKAMPTIKTVFKGFFAAIEIGQHIFKGIVRVIKAFVVSLNGVAGNPAVDFITKLANGMINLNKSLVEGGGLEKFFDKLVRVVQKPAIYIEKLKNAIQGMFDGGGIPGGEEASSLLERISERFESFGKTMDWIKEKTRGVRDALSDFWNHISTWFGELRQKLKDALKPGDFNEVVDALNVGLLGGIALLLRKFLKDGLKLDFGGGVVDKIRETFGELTNTLKAMQADLKSKALLRIAIAVGVLTASVLVLSMIDSAALTKALVAMAVGFGQLVAVMSLMGKFSADFSGPKMVLVASSLILLAGAMLVLSIAMKIMATMSWEEIGKGLAGVGGGLLLLTSSTKLIAADTGGLIRAGIAMGIMAAAMLVLALAVKAFATMEWGEMGKGLAGVAGGLAAITAAMNLMPKSGMIQAGIGIGAISIAMLILSQAVKQFAGMSWTELAKGLGAVAVGLGAIVLITNLIPYGGLVSAGAGLILVSIALNIMARAVDEFSDMSLEELAKGIGAIAAMLLILVVATNAMNGALTGAAAMTIVAGALFILTEVLMTLAKLNVAQLLMALGAIAGVFIVLGVAGYVLGPLIFQIMGLGIALGLIGAAFALFGVGVMFVAKAFEILAKSGAAGAKAIVEIIKVFVTARLVIVKELAATILAMAKELLEGSAPVVKALGVLLGHLLDTVIELVPKIAEAVGVIITAILGIIREKVPEFLVIGAELILALLRGIRDNMYEFATIAIDIIANMAQAFSDNAQTLVDAAFNLIISMLEAMSNGVDQVVEAGVQFIVSFIEGLAQGADDILAAAANLITTFIEGIASMYLDIIDAGFDVLMWFLAGIANNIIQVADLVTDIVVAFIAELGKNATKIGNAGTAVLVRFIKGMTDNIVKVTNAVGTLITRFINAVGENATRIVGAGTNAIIKFLDGVKSSSKTVINKFSSTGLYVMQKLADSIIFTTKAAADILIDFLNALSDAIDQKAPAIRRAGRKLAGSIIDGLTGGLASRAGDVVGKLKDIAGNALDGVKGFFGINSPSKVFKEIGINLMEGLSMGIAASGRQAEVGAVKAGERVVTGFKGAIGKMPKAAVADIDINPRITPVLDLSKVKAGAKSLSGMMDISGLRVDASFSRALSVSAATQPQTAVLDAPPPAENVGNTFIQNNYSPKALSTSDIYRNTKSQFALEKEELGIS